ncbi:MAG: XTP/dITP diphosphatase [Actinobacteria bacterium]|nr:XTP/dITP diphosphatase [Actinomycetota bacterium]
MTRIVLATRNQGKVRELRDLLADLNVRVIPVSEFPGCPEVDETGETFEENALLKARAVAAFTGEIALADDSGLEVDALGGLPGVRSARFAGPGASDEDNNRKLLELLRGVPAERRTARFQSVVAIASPSGKAVTAEGSCEGTIGFEPRGEGGFGYDPLFVIPGGSTLAVIDERTKNRISHRGMAFRNAKARLAEFLK